LHPSAKTSQGFCTFPFFAFSPKNAHALPSDSAFISSCFISQMSKCTKEASLSQPFMLEIVLLARFLLHIRANRNPQIITGGFPTWQKSIWSALKLFASST
jgi:hypothetical protein